MIFLSKFRLILGKVQNVYSKTTNRHPYFAQAVQVSFLMGSGDLIAQTLVEKTPIREINIKRVSQFAGLGLILVGPSLRYWYGLLDRIIKPSVPQFRRGLQKVCLDQLLFAPAFICIFTTAISTIQGLHWQEIKNRLNNDYLDILTANYCIWPAAQMINFSMIPLKFQVIFVQFIAILWNSYLSWKVAEKKHSKN